MLSAFPLQNCRKCAFHSKTAPCQGCSKAGQRTTFRVSGAGDRAGKVGGVAPRTRPEGAGSLESDPPTNALAGSPPRTGPGGPGSLESASLGPQTCWGYSSDVFGKIGGVCSKPRKPPSRWNLPAWGPRPAWGYPPDLLRTAKKPKRPQR